jgi:hypothetical protein
MTIRPDSLFDNFGVSLDKNFAKFKVVRYNNIFFYHLFKFNPLNFLGFSPCTNEDDGKIIHTKILFAKEILVGTTTYYINVMNIFYISNIPKIYK